MATLFGFRTKGINRLERCRSRLRKQIASDDLKGEFVSTGSRTGGNGGIAFVVEKKDGKTLTKIILRGCAVTGIQIFAR